MQSWLVLGLSGCYLGILFAVAWWGDRRAARGTLLPPAALGAALFYALTLGVYNTTWSFYGSVGRAAASGFDFLPIYLGPSLLLLFGQRFYARLIRLAKQHNVTSIADFIAARYGKSQVVAATVTLIALFSVLPYIALQLKAVGASYDVLTLGATPVSSGGRPIWRDTAFAVALSMALFTILFGVRHIHASEHHRGLMLAIAFESVVKLGAFLAVALFILFGLFDGFGDLLAQARPMPELAALLTPDFSHPTWLSNTVIATIAFVCLPQLFHVTAVENESAAHCRTASWFYPGYLLVFSLFMVPIGIAGRLMFPIGIVDPDTYMITLPIAGGAQFTSLAAFIGGLSAATGMVIVAALSLSTMLCNDVVMPLLLRLPRLADRERSADISAILLRVRRIAVLAILLMAYGMYRLVDRGYPLTEIGLWSFVGVAQFGPALFGGLIWRRANRAGALAGMLVGCAAWCYTLILPSVASLLPLPPGLLEQGPFGLAWARPYGLFGLELDPISHASLISLTANLVLFVLVSCLTRPSAVERIQADAFGLGDGGSDREGAGSLSWRAVTRMQDLRGVAMRFVGQERGAAAFEAYLETRRNGGGPPLERSGLADLDAVRFTEKLVAGAIGAASARVVMGASLQGRLLSRGDAMAMLDEASEALRFNRKLLQATLESIGQGILVVDAEFRVSAWNRRLMDLLDFPPDLVRVGMPLAEIIRYNAGRGEYDADDVKALIINRDFTGQHWPYVYERRRPDGRVLEISSNIMPEGGYVTTYTDVSERHHAATALRDANEGLERRVRERTHALQRATGEAEQANASKTRFLAAASHDLLQPLNAARLFVSALEESLRTPAPAVSDAQRGQERLSTEYAAVSLRSAEQLLGGLLDICSLDSGAVQPAVSDIPVERILSRLGVEFSALAEARGLSLSVVASHALVRSDPQLLRRVLQNFLSNAIRYTERGRVLLGCRRRGDRLSIEVWDTGPGIPPDKQQEVFEEFRRLAPHASGRELSQRQDGLAPGLGLGLAIVDRISRILEHPVRLRSRPGRATCFAVDVPLVAARAPAAAPADAPAVPPVAEAITVLCIDNEASIVQGMTALLGQWGCHVVGVTDPDAALAALEGAVPDAVLLDYHLHEGQHGLAVLARLRDHWGVAVRALLITADRTEAVRRDAEALGCGVLYKPVRPASLRRFLNGVVLQADRPAATDDAA